MCLAVRALVPGNGLWRRRLGCEQGKEWRKVGRALWGAMQCLCPGGRGRWYSCSMPSPCGGCLKPLRASLKGGDHFLWDLVRPFSSSPTEEPTHAPLPKDPAPALVPELPRLEAGWYMAGVGTLNSHTPGFRFWCCHKVRYLGQVTLTLAASVSSSGS